MKKIMFSEKYGMLQDEKKLFKTKEELLKSL